MILTFDINKGKWKGKKASLVQNGDGYVHIRVHDKNVKPDGRGWLNRVIHYQGGHGHRGYQMGKHFFKNKHIVLKLREVGVEFPDVDYEALEKKFAEKEPREFRLEWRYPVRIAIRPVGASILYDELNGIEFGYAVEYLHRIHRSGMCSYVKIGTVFGQRGHWLVSMGKPRFDHGGKRYSGQRIKKEMWIMYEDIIDHVFATRDEAMKHVVIRHKMENRD